MNPDTNSLIRCGKCGKDIEADRFYCGQCAIEMAEENIPVPDGVIHAHAGSAKRGIKTLTKLFVLLTCLAIIAFRMPALFAAFETAPPLREGTHRTDAETDRCVRNLWRISRILQDGGLPGNDIVCPASGRPYIITGSGRDAVARCPAPELHGVGEISVSRDSPRPKVEP